MMKRILIVEDDASIALGLEELLRAEQYDVVTCRRGDTALAALLRFRPDLVVLDVMLPGLSGYDVCRQIREKQLTTPILMLTAKSQELDKVVGLEIGADDYLGKPFGARELLARIHALLRRSQPSPPREAVLNEEPFRIGECEIRPKKLQLRRGGIVDDLTPRELKLLQIFHHSPGDALPRDRLLNEAWGPGYYGTTRTLDQVIVQLRRKLGEPTDHPRHLQTVHGYGYRLVA